MTTIKSSPSNYKICTYCGKNGHRAHQCPLRVAQPLSDSNHAGKSTQEANNNTQQQGEKK